MHALYTFKQNLPIKSIMTKEITLAYSSHKAHKLCDEFAKKYELPTDYVYMEFVDPTVATLEAVTLALDVAALMVYD